MMKRILSSAKAKAHLLKSIGRDNSAVAMVEFAFSAPLVLGMGLAGVETANYTITHMQISQIAMQVADNTSRVGENDVLVAKRVFEDDINDSLIGAEQLGSRFAVYENGRIIVSSLQVNEDDGQWIAWQRCRGAKQFVSQYGTEGTGASGTSFPGMGDAGNRITASPGTAVMYVEISYDYEPITPFEFFGDTEIEYEAAFNIRDSRDLTGLYNTTNPAAPVARCNVFSADRPT